MMHHLVPCAILLAASSLRAQTHPLVGVWDVDVVAAHKLEDHGTTTPIMSKGVFSFTVEGDSLIAMIKVQLSPSPTPIRVATLLGSDTATFVRASRAITTENRTMSAKPMTTTFRFFAVGDSLRGTITRTLENPNDPAAGSSPVSGVRR
jgi:hypothetical protein